VTRNERHQPNGRDGRSGKQISPERMGHELSAISKQIPPESKAVIDMVVFSNHSVAHNPTYRNRNFEKGTRMMWSIGARWAERFWNQPVARKEWEEGPRHPEKMG